MRSLPTKVLLLLFLASLLIAVPADQPIAAQGASCEAIIEQIDAALTTCEYLNENWVCYGSTQFSASELTVPPGRTATVRNAAAYGMIMMQGHGRMGVWDVETPAMIRLGQLTSDEFFVSESAATEGVTIINPSPTEPLVMLKHFGPGNPDLML